MIAVAFGCASPKTDNMKRYKIKYISDIIIKEHSELLILSIKGNQILPYTADKQLSPIGIVLHFSETALEIPKRVYTPPNNEIISYIKANEIIEDKITNARIFIALRKDALYDLVPADAELQIIFPKAIAFSNDSKPPKKIAGKKLDLKLFEISLPAATQKNGYGNTSKKQCCC